MGQLGYDVGRSELPEVELGGKERNATLTSFTHCSLAFNTSSRHLVSHSEVAMTAGNRNWVKRGEKRAATPPIDYAELDDTADPSNTTTAGPSKKAKPSSPSAAAAPPTLHAWLHPDEPAPFKTHSPPIHHSSSTFLSFAISFVPGSHITTEALLAKEARRLVRELNVPIEVGEEVMKDDEGAFEGGDGRVVSLKGKERAREPDHRMWAVRTICLKDGKDGTKGEDDYEVSERSDPHPFTGLHQQSRHLGVLLTLSPAARDL